MKTNEKILLEYIMNHPFCDAQEVMQQLSLKERQLIYRLSKLNIDLKAQGFLPVTRKRKGIFMLDKALFLSIEHEKKAELHDAKQYSEIILLRILSTPYVSLDDLSWLCSLSKNSILNEIKELKISMDNMGLCIQYTRKTGYQVLGDEETIRKLLYQVLESVMIHDDATRWMNIITDIKKEDSDILYYQFTRLEKLLEREFLDEQIRKMVYFLYVIQIRMKNGKMLIEPSPYENQIRGTKEFQAVIKIFSFLTLYPSTEQVYITSLILSSKVAFIKHENQNSLMIAIEKVCQNFENICQIQLQEKDRESFKTALFQHWQPTQYHIQFNFHVENPLHEYIIEKYKYLYICTKEITEPLAALLEVSIPPQELSLLTILLGGWLKKYEVLDTKIRLTAVVVCPSGISISNLVFFNLKALFPEIHFITYCSVRQFKSLDYAYDIIFSTVPLKTSKRIFLIKPDFHEEYTRQLRRSVINSLFQNDDGNIQLATLMQIIEGFAQIEDRNLLEKKLHAYLYPHDEKREKYIVDAQEPSLLQLLVASHIQFHSADIHWKEAIKLASAPLIEDETIDAHYIDRMISIIEKDKPFIEIGKEIMIAHASIEDGVLQPCISLLQLKKPIEIAGYFKASTIFVLATTDYQIHLKALNQLFEIIKDQERQHRLKTAASCQEIIDLLEEIVIRDTE